MTTGSSAALLGVVATALAACATAAMAAAPAEWGIEQLMKGFGAVQSSRARYVERKHMAILSMPLESSGVLAYTAPGRLEKHTLKPRQESLILDRDRLTLERGERQQPRTVALPDYPVIWALVEGIRSTLAGDLATLKRYYQVSFDGGERKWQLTLRPADPKMLEVVSEIRIGGGRSEISLIEIIEAGGDRSVMTIAREDP